MDTPCDPTPLLADLETGDPEAAARLLPLVYAELRDLAARYLRAERPGHTFQPTALVHEAFLKLVGQDRVRWRGRGHFFRVAALAMRRILVDSARRHQAAKRGGGQRPLSLGEVGAVLAEAPVDLVALDDCLRRLGEIDPEQARIVELRFFAGLSIEEAALVLEISPATVKRDWRVARAWLFRELGSTGGAEDRV